MPSPEGNPLPILLRRAGWPVRTAIISGLVLLALGLVTGLAPVIGIRVLPTTEWVAQVRPFAVGLGVVGGIGLAALVWIGARAQGEAGTMKTWAVMIFAALMGYWLATGLAYTGPALVGATGQAQVTHGFTVREVPRGSSRRCDNAVRLSGLIFMADEVCGVPDEIRALLAPGTRVELTGTGNALGLRPARIRPVR